jgi:hypothetical protein
MRPTPKQAKRVFHKLSREVAYEDGRQAISRKRAIVLGIGRVGCWHKQRNGLESTQSKVSTLLLPLKAMEKLLLQK